MKIAYISFGHIDVTLPLLKNLHATYNHEIDYYILLCARYPLESVLDIRGKNLSSKIYSINESLGILPDWFKKYINNKIKIRIILYPYNKLWSLKTHLLFYRFSKTLKRENYDLIHFSGMSFFILDLLFSPFLKKIPKIITIHDLIPHSGEDSKIRRILNLQKFVAKKFPVILQNKDDFLKISKMRNVHYIPFGILDFYSMIEAIEAKESDILCFGRMSPYKGIPELLAAFRILLESNPGLKLCIAGNGNLEVSTNDLNNNLHLINRYISVEELAGLIKRTKIVVCPYRDATQSAVLATAHAFSKATVVTNIAGLKDVVVTKFNGILVPPNDPDSLAEGIGLLLNEKYRNQIEHNIEDFYKDSLFSWGNIAKKQNDVYKELIAYS